MTSPEAGPGVGDLVRDQDGRERVVTDIRRGVPILRPRYALVAGEPASNPEALVVLARLGEWS